MSSEKCHPLDEFFIFIHPQRGRPFVHEDKILLFSTQKCAMECRKKLARKSNGYEMKVVLRKDMGKYEKYARYVVVDMRIRGSVQSCNGWRRLMDFSMADDQTDSERVREALETTKLHSLRNAP